MSFITLASPGFTDPDFFDAGWGRLLTTPTVGGLAVLLAAVLAFAANAWKIRADKADTTKKIDAARVDLDKKIKADRADNDRKLAAAREDASRTRTGEAYVQVLEVVGHIGHWAQKVRPYRDTDPPQESPPLPDLALQAASQARLQVYGSKPVQDLWKAWDLAVREIQRADQVIQLTQGPRALDTWGRLEDELRPAEQTAREALGEAMNRELAGSA